MLKLELRARCIVDQRDRTSWLAQKVHSLWKPCQLSSGLRIGHLEVIHAAVCQTCQTGL
tara:strand:- start:1 stop:177 length:177 start_codon:yes stop_codon:yes gene_type:complete